MNKDYTAIRALAESDSTELNVRPYLEEWARLHYPKSWSPNGSPDPMGAVPEMDSDWAGNAWEDLEESLPWKNPETPQGELIGLLPSKMYYPSAREAALKDFLGHLNLKQGAAVNTYSAYLTKESSIKIANNLTRLIATKRAESAAWQRSEGKNPAGGLNRKGVASYRAENPGSKLQMAVTTEPSKLDPDSKAAKRRKSFCARMGGMPGPMQDEKNRPTRKALSLKKWNC